MNMIILCKDSDVLSGLEDDWFKLNYKLFLRFNTDSVDILISREDKKPENSVAYIVDNYEECKEKLDEIFLNNSIENPFGTDRAYKIMGDIIPYLRSFLDRNNLSWHENAYSEFHNFYMEPNRIRNDKEFIKHLKQIFSSDDDNIVFISLFIVSFLYNKDELEYQISIEYIRNILLKKYSISDIESGECAIKIGINDIKKILKSLND